MNKTKTILCIGSIAFDTIETPNGNRKNLLGGSATYFSIASSIFTSVKIVGIVGNDYPNSGWEMFKSRNINTDNILVKNGNTFQWGAKYNNDYSSRDTLFTDLGVFDGYFPSINKKDCDDPLIFLGNIQPALQIGIAKLSDKAEYIVSDTMNLWIDLYADKLKEVLGLTTIFFINHEEAAQFTGENKISIMAERLLSYGPKTVIIKMGSEGSYISTENDDYYVPAYPINEVIDPTGAGDSFAGGFLGYLSINNKPDILEAVLTGTAVASYCVEGFGLNSLLSVTPLMINKRIKKLKTLI